jgi:hypothetical protein
VPLLELVFRAHIEHRGRPGAKTIEQLIAGNRLKLVSRPEIARHYSRDLGAVPLADAAKRLQQRHDYIVSGQPIEDPLAVSPALDERRAAEKLQVPGGIRDGQPGPGGQVVDAPLALAKMLEQFEAMGVTERLRYVGETGEYLLFRTHA